jgi:outer membrane lipoprotein-sorting protein
MKCITLLLLVIFPIANNNSEDVLAKMYKQYAGKWMKSFSFSQTTERYQNDSLVNTSTWYEHIVYPDKFRIDFGDTTSGNAAIIAKDSVYSFRKGVLARTSVNDDNLTFMLGGMYFYPYDSVKAMLTRSGYDLNKFYETKLNGNDVYVIGANNAGDTTKQLWIDKEKLVVVKFVSYNNGEKEEGIFSNHKQFGNSWSETACSFYVDGKLIQKEKYFNCKAGENINLKIFDYKNFSKVE